MDKPKSINTQMQVKSPERLVYLVTRDQPFASYVSKQLTHFGYFIQHVGDIKSLANSVSDNPITIMVDLPTDEYKNPKNSVFIEIDKLELSSCNLIFTSEYDDQTVRLKSIQAGGKAFFTKPINVVNLVDKLNSLHRTISNPQPFRVLIVESDQIVASYYQMILKMSGMEAQIAPKSINVLDQVREFHPDLILMDTFMPEVNTADLARVIRQIDDFVSIPIIFLSSEDDFTKRIEALDLGGDDFLDQAH